LVRKKRMENKRKGRTEKRRKKGGGEVKGNDMWRLKLMLGRKI
jgi:hypothetical protein